MGNRHSCTEGVNDSTFIENEEEKDICDEEDSYGAKPFNSETSEKKTIKLVLPDDNTDDSNNTQSESTASNQSFNRSFGSSTTRTKYGETNSVVTSDYGSEGSWSDVGETSKSSTRLSKESVLYATDDDTDITDLAHYGDDEGTKNTEQQSKKKRRSKWLKMMQTQEHVRVENNIDDDEVETVLDFNEERSLRSMIGTMQSREKTDGDDETTIHIIDADEEYSRCSCNEAPNQDGPDVDHSKYPNRGLLHQKTGLLDNEKVLENASKSKSHFVAGDLLNTRYDVEYQKFDTLPINQNATVVNETISGNVSMKQDETDGICKDKENGQKEAILHVDGLTGDPMEVNESRCSMTSSTPYVSRNSIVLKESLSLTHNTSTASSSSTVNKLESLPPKKCDPSGVIARGKDIPEKNKRKVARKLLDDVELNPKRTEIQRQLTLGVSPERHQNSLHTISSLDKSVGQSLARSTRKCETNLILTTKSKSSDPLEQIKDQRSTQNNLSITLKPDATTRQSCSENFKCDTPSKPSKKMTVELTMEDQRSLDDKQHKRKSKKTECSKLEVVHAYDVQLPESINQRPLLDVIVDAPKINVENIQDVKHQLNSKQASHGNDSEIKNGSSWDLPTAKKSIPESYHRIDNHQARSLSYSATNESAQKKLFVEKEQSAETINHITENENGIHAKRKAKNMKLAPIGTQETSQATTSLMGKAATDEEVGLCIPNIGASATKTDLLISLEAPIDEEMKSSIANMKDSSEVGLTPAIAIYGVPGLPDSVERKIVGRRKQRQLSPSKIMIRPEMCYIETTGTALVGSVDSLHAFEPKKTTKPVSPRPENDENRARKAMSRQSTNISSVIEVIDDDDDIDLEVAKQYDETFSELIRRFPHFTAQNPSLMEIIRVAKLQKILAATLEMERELEDYVQSLQDQKNEVAAHYQKKLLEASRRNAEREYHLQKELDSLKSLADTQERNNQWEMICMYKDHLGQYQHIHNSLLSQRFTKSEDPLSLLPNCLSSEKQSLLEALETDFDGDNCTNQNVDGDNCTNRNENAILSQEVNKLENELSRLKQSPEANMDTWVDSVLCNMDSRQLDYLKQRIESNSSEPVKVQKFIKSNNL